jgi:hypothetical protein
MSATRESASDATPTAEDADLVATPLSTLGLPLSLPAGHRLSGTTQIMIPHFQPKVRAVTL